MASWRNLHPVADVWLRLALAMLMLAATEQSAVALLQQITSDTLNHPFAFCVLISQDPSLQVSGFHF